MRNLVLLEDDPVQSELLVEELTAEFPEASIMLITSESEFQSRIDEFTNSPPDVFILDVMVRWTKPSPNLDSNSENRKSNGYYRAGIDCAKLLRTSGINTPIILYTILENNDIRADIKSLEDSQIKDVRYVRKESDPFDLMKRIRSVVKHSSQG
jgi:DNA-binding NarL/FixJ family response regulator